MSRVFTGPLKRALVLENPHDSLDELLFAGGFEQVARVRETPDEARLLELIAEHRPQVLFKRSRVPITRAVLEAAQDLVSIQLCCIGDDSIDKGAAAERGVLVFNDPISNGQSVVELVLGHLVALSRRLYETYDDTHAGIWDKGQAERYEIQGKVLGVVGLGNIGRRVARMAERLGMKVVFHDSREVAQEVGEEMGWSSLPDIASVFRGSDAVTLHMSASDIHGDSNTNCITRDMLMTLGSERPDNSPRLFINLARGNLYEPQDLLDDVYPDEPRNNGPGWDNPYAEEPRIATTPHIGAATQEAQPRIARRVSHTCLAFSAHNTIRDCVFSPRTRVSFADDHRDGRAVLVVVHSTTRGTKKAVQDAIYEAGADSLRSAHRDFSRWGIAVDVNLIDKPLEPFQLRSLIDHTSALTGDHSAVRLVRQVVT
jgi:D-3-phosphoglycerate dehydrogenase